MNIDRNSATVVDDGDAVVDMDRYIDLVAMTGQRFVDGVVDDLVDQMMKTALAVSPMYIPGRFLTASNPSKTLIFSALYSDCASGFDSAIFDQSGREILLVKLWG